MTKRFYLDVNVINGEVYEFPQRFYFECDKVKVIGEQIIRYFDDELCSVAMKTFYILYQSELFGTNQFKTEQQFWDYTQCFKNDIFVFLNGCNMLLNGRKVIIKT